MKKTEPNSWGSRLQWAIWWLLPVALGWGVLAVLSRQTTQWAIAWTQTLFGWTLLLSYVCIWGAIIALSRDARAMLIRAIAVTLTVTTVMIGLEVAAGLKLVHWRLVFEKIGSEGSEYITSFRLDRDLGFRRPPNARWSGRPPSDIERGFLIPASLSEPIAFTYDQQGYRNATQLHDTEVVLIGDSYIEGAYVSDDQTVASKLEMRLGKPVGNLGIAGYGSLQELVVLKKDAPRYRPSIVVWFFFEGNDLYDDQRTANELLMEPAGAAETPHQPEDITAGQGWRKRSFILALIRQMRLWSEPLVPAQAPYFGHMSGAGGAKEKVYFADYAAVPWSGWLMNRWRATVSTFQQAKDLAEQQGVEILFCLIPTKFRVYQPFIEYSEGGPMGSWATWPIPELFLEACESADLACLDLTAVLQDAVRNGGMPYATVDTHWSAEGNELVAALLADEFCRRKWLHECARSEGGASDLRKAFP